MSLFVLLPDAGTSLLTWLVSIGMAMIFLQAAAFPSAINSSDKVADYFNQGER